MRSVKLKRWGIIFALGLSIFAIAQNVPNLPGFPSTSGGSSGGSSVGNYWVDAGIESSGGVFPAGGTGQAMTAPGPYFITMSDQATGLWFKQKSSGGSIATGLQYPAITLFSHTGGFDMPGIEFRAGFQYSNRIGYIYGTNVSNTENAPGVNIAANVISFNNMTLGDRFGQFNGGSRGFIAESPSGTNAWQNSINGARIDLGTATNDYFISDGTGIQSPGYVRVGSFTDAGLPSPAEGAIAFGSSTGGLKLGNGTAWLDISSGGGSTSFFYDAGAGFIQSNETILKAKAGTVPFDQNPATMPEAFRSYSTNSSLYTTASFSFYGSTNNFIGDITGNDAFNGNQLRSGITIRANCGSGADCGINFSSRVNDAMYGSFQGTGLFMRSATGTDAIKFETTGARLHLSNSSTGPDYWVSNSTNTGTETPGSLRVGDAGLFVDGVARLVTDGGTRSDVAMYTGTTYQGALRASANTVVGYEPGLNLSLPSGKNFSIYTESGGGTTTVFRDYGTAEFNASSGNNAIQFNSSGAFLDLGGGTNDAMSSDGTGPGTPGYLRATQGFCSGAACAGTAFASFPVATGTATSRLRFDSTNGVWRYSDGTNWIAITTEFGYSAFFPAGIAVATPILVQQIRLQKPAAIKRISSVIAIAGTGVGTWTYEVRNLTTTTILCTSAAIGCTQVAESTQSTQCPAGGLFSAADDLQIRINTASCTTSPAVNLTADLMGGG